MITTGQRLLTVTVEVLGSGAYDKIVSVQNSLQLDSVKENLKRSQTAEITIDSPVTVGLVYTVTIAGVPVTYTSIGGDDQEAVRDALILAVNTNLFINPNPLRLNVKAIDGVTMDEFILTSRVGKEFTVTVETNLILGIEVNAVSLVVIGDDGTVNVAELQETTWEPRQSMDIFFRSHTTIVETPDYIEEAEITGDVEGNTITINVEP